MSLAASDLAVRCSLALHTSASVKATSAKALPNPAKNCQTRTAAAERPLSGQSGDFAGTRGKGETRQLQLFFMGRHRH